MGPEIEEREWGLRWMGSRGDGRRVGDRRACIVSLAVSMVAKKGKDGGENGGRQWELYGERVGGEVERRGMTMWSRKEKDGEEEMIKLGGILSLVAVELCVPVTFVLVGNIEYSILWSRLEKLLYRMNKQTVRVL